MTHLKTLSLSFTDPEFHLLHANSKCESLRSLDLSGVKIVRTQSKHLDLQRFLHLTPNLSTLNLSRTNIAPDVLKDLLEEVPNLEHLDLSDNNLGDSGLVAVEEPLKSCALKSLNLSGNFDKRTSFRTKAMDVLSALCNDSTSRLESLIVSGASKAVLKSDLIPFILSLMTNQTLKTLDVSKNQGGNGVAVALAKLLQGNSTLDSLYWDDNGTTLVGFQIFRNALSRNSTVKAVHVPNVDVSSALKNDKNNASVILETIGDIQKKSFANAMASSPKVKETEEVTLRVSKPKPRRVIDARRASTIYGHEELMNQSSGELTPEELEQLKAIQTPKKNLPTAPTRNRSATVADRKTKSPQPIPQFSKDAESVPVREKEKEEKVRGRERSATTAGPPRVRLPPGAQPMFPIPQRPIKSETSRPKGPPKELPKEPLKVPPKGPPRTPPKESQKESPKKVAKEEDKGAKESPPEVSEAKKATTRKAPPQLPPKRQEVKKEVKKKEEEQKEEKEVEKKEEELKEEESEEESVEESDEESEEEAEE